MTVFARRRSVRTGLVVVGIVMLVAAVATWWLAPFRSNDRLAYLGPDPAGLVGWSLAPLGAPFRPDAAQDATVVRVSADWWPACPPWDQGAGDDSWLMPEISYLPWSVTITLRTSDAFASSGKCGQGFYDFWGQGLEVHLSEPLGGRPLFDGSTSPSTAVPYR